MDFKKIVNYTVPAIGVCCVIGGIISVGAALTSHYKSEAERDDLLLGASKGETVMTAPTSTTNKSASSPVEGVEGEEVTISGELLEEGIAELDGDQEVAEITEGTQVLEIPDLDIRVPILEGTSYEVLKVAAGHFKGTGKMGSGNYCIAGHSVSSYACIFDNLHKVKMDIPVYLYNKKGKKFTYWVTDWKTVQPSDTWVINGYGDDRCTLITCDDKGKTRLVVTALKMTDEEHEKYLREKEMDKRLEVKDLSYEYANLGISEYINALGKPVDKRYGIYGDAFTERKSEGSVLGKGILSWRVGNYDI